MKYDYLFLELSKSQTGKDETGYQCHDKKIILFFFPGHVTYADFITTFIFLQFTDDRDSFCHCPTNFKVYSQKNS